MLQKLLIVSFLAATAMAQTSMIICSFGFEDDICTCNFLIFNPSGLNNLTLVGNPVQDCTFEDAQQAIGMGRSRNIPSAICNQLPKLEKLSVEDVGVEHLNGNVFRNCGNLKILQLGRNLIESVPPNVFSTTVLERIELNDNKLRSIDEHSFDSLSNLRTLDISGNSDGMILPDAVFDQIPNLQNLLLNNCNLGDLNARWFENLRSLVNIDLSSNTFTSIPSTMFNSLSGLRLLDLSKGVLATIPETTFRNNTMLLVLDLSSNNISEIHSNLFVNQQYLINLHMSENINITIPADAFRNLLFLRVLELGSNNIAALSDGWFSSLRTLVSIDLSNNVISDIPDKTFTATSALETINLSRNKITKLDSRSFGPLQRLIDLNVQNNEIDEVDHYFMTQPAVLRNVNFLDNECTQLYTENFSEFRSLFMNEMRTCFDKFDKHPISLLTFNSTIYDWYSIRTNDGWDSIEVTVMAYENVHIALSDSMSGGNSLIEVQIGQTRNRFSNILDQGEVVYTDETRGRLSETAERSFIIGWRFGIVMVFRKGDQLPFMAYSNRNGFSVNFFGLRSMIVDSDHKAEWTVTRLQVATTRSMWKVYGDIEAKLKRGIPIDLNQYLR